MASKFPGNRPHNEPADPVELYIIAITSTDRKIKESGRKKNI